jgi:hypothetical protein
VAWERRDECLNKREEAVSTSEEGVSKQRRGAQKAWERGSLAGPLAVQGGWRHPSLVSLLCGRGEGYFGEGASGKRIGAEFRLRVLRFCMLLFE